MNDAIGPKIRDSLADAGLGPLGEAAIGRLSVFVSLILRWNSRVNLTSVRDEDGIISRHIIESIDVSYRLPDQIRTLLDFGSGAGFPGIPIAICRPEIEVTLAESQNKKAAFLMEAVRTLGIEARVHAGRAQELKSQFACVTLRAVDRMSEAVKAGAALVAPDGWLALMTTAASLEELQVAAGSEFNWKGRHLLTGGDSRILALGQKIGSQA